MKELIIGGRKFSNRFFLGTGKFASRETMEKALAASGTELVTAALTRVREEAPESDDILSCIDRAKVEVMLNTSGARNADEAVRIARIALAAGYRWIKLEIHPDARYLLPDPVETLAAVERCAKLGMVVLPYINADPVLARRCEEAGAAAVMPLGSPIGSNLGLRTRDMISIIVEQSHVPVVVDAGIGLPSHAAEAIELGADAVLANTAVAAAGDPVAMAEAFRLAVRAAELAIAARPPAPRSTASATSPMDDFDIFKEGESL
ncbi:MAG: thiazole synthase [Kiritimatiellae bacterium]|nr:thiazole synthase [Kiritimatiellia bacterium]